jgi:hypothetical protein
MNAPQPKFVAEAIARLKYSDTVAAWRYLDDWSALEFSRVPIASIRECLAPAQLTEPLGVVLPWAEDGGRGLLCVIGPNGTGKTFAAARWVLHRHERGAWTRWLAATVLASSGINEREKLIAESRDQPALVIDDIGAGGGDRDYLRDQLRGLIQHRVDNGRGTLVIGNATASQIAAWIGERLKDRQRAAGGVVELKSSRSLRTPVEVEPDDAGRGPEWHAARRLLDLLGCEATQDRGPDGERLPLSFRVGGLLERRCRQPLHADSVGAYARAIKALGLDEQEVLTEALRVQDEQRGAARRIGRDFGADAAASLDSFEAAMGFALERLRSQAETAEQERREKLAAVREEERQRADRHRKMVEQLARNPDNATPPKWASGKDGRAKLRKLGFAVSETSAGWRVLYRDTVLATGCSSDVEAWALAARRCAGDDGVARREESAA